MGASMSAGDHANDLASALRKSILAGDENAALYWLRRMVLKNIHLPSICRRLIKVACEDIGLADPHALNQAATCYHACISLCIASECDVILAQCVIYLARAPKSDEVYKALEKVKQRIREAGDLLPAVPLHLRNSKDGI